jgi:predicted DNA-binding protein YlxM (UPF0122 family)
MFYADLKDLPDARFKRLTGVSPATFDEMLAVIKTTWRDFGRPSKCSRPDQLLMTLMYWREYRSLAHIAATYHVSEPTVSRTIRRVEDTLIQSGQFALPGKKALTESSCFDLKVVIVDATETPIQRPKKTA